MMVLSGNWVTLGGKILNSNYSPVPEAWNNIDARGSGGRQASLLTYYDSGALGHGLSFATALIVVVTVTVLYPSTVRTVLGDRISITFSWEIP